MEERQKVFNFIANAIKFMEIERIEPYCWSDNLKKFRIQSLCYFDQAEPFFGNDAEGLAVNQERYFFADATLDALDNPLDITLLVDNEDKPNSNTDIIAVRYRQIIDKTQLRNIDSRPFNYIIEQSMCFLDLKKNKAKVNRGYLGSFNGLQWFRCRQDWQKNRQSKKEVEEDSRRLRAVMGIQFTRRYEWTVIFKFDNKPGILLPTDPLGIKDVFKFRDIPPGKERREALIHWVSSHYRKKRNNHDDLIKVRAYLRGQTEFNWNGFKCIISPSEHDLHIIQKAK